MRVPAAMVVICYCHYQIFILIVNDSHVLDRGSSRKGEIISYHRPIHLNQARLGAEAVINRRHERAPDQKHDPDVIQPIPELRYGFGMIRDGVERRRHAETQHGAEEVAGESQDVVGCGEGKARFDGEIHGRADGAREDRSEEMRPDVDAFVVDVGQTRDGFDVRVRRRAIAALHVVVVLHPYRHLGQEDRERV